MPLASAREAFLFSGMTSSPCDPARWEKLGSVTRLQTRVFDVADVHYRHGPRGTSRDFVVINAPDWVNVVALTPDHHLVLVRQFRFGIDEFSLEVPGGVIEAGEDPLVAGLRELQEETGYAGTNARFLGSVHPNPAIQSNRCHLVLVEQVRKLHELAWDPDEEMHVLTKPVDEVYQLARTGGITHSMVMNALLLFEPHWNVLRAGRH
ncbi:MAG TPA: NUDIX hydrolase [Opitutaceae bacterium]|nr:NUDIX hydrolase [Opitutaceae bacterium]